MITQSSVVEHLEELLEDTTLAMEPFKKALAVVAVQVVTAQLTMLQQHQT
jgi:hypothetical protein